MTLYSQPKRRDNKKKVHLSIPKQDTYSILQEHIHNLKQEHMYMARHVCQQSAQTYNSGLSLRNFTKEFRLLIIYTKGSAIAQYILKCII